jgi:hypothetical protein
MPKTGRALIEKTSKNPWRASFGREIGAKNPETSVFDGQEIAIIVSAELMTIRDHMDIWIQIGSEPNVISFLGRTDADC